MCPSDGSGNYSLPAGYLAVADTTILTTQHNPILEDIATALTARIMASGAKAMTGDLTLANSTPTNATHAASKGYVDAQIAAMLQKASAIVRTTANITLSGEQTLDGVLTSASRVLVMAQTAPAENGIYVSAAGAWSRATDMDAWAEVPGAIVVVQQGTLYADSVWFCTSNTGGTLGTTAITFARLDLPLKKRRATSGTSDTILANDLGKFVTTSNGSAIAVTVPQATTLFGDGFWFISQNLGAGAATYTPTTSTVNGAATLVSRTGDAYLWMSDGTNYTAVPLGPTYAWLIGLTEDATGAVGDFVWTGDVSTTLNKKMLLSTIQTLFAASAADQETGSSAAKNVTPAVQHRHASAAKAWVNFDGTGTVTIQNDYGVSSITDNAGGDFTVNFDQAFSSANYAFAVTPGQGTGTAVIVAFSAAAAPSASAFRFQVNQIGVGAFDPDPCSAIFFGDH
jgi:hypothetical protein